MKQFFNKFQNLKGASFIGIDNYKNKFGEISNLSVLTGISVLNAKTKDLETLKSLGDGDLILISSFDEILPLDVLNIALTELITSAEKNLSKDKTEKTNQSIAQTDAYLTLTNSVKLHKETTNIFITGFINNKSIIVKGIYPSVNKRIKTECKDAIKKYCNLRMSDYRQYNIGSMNKLSITGSTIQMT